MHYAEIRDISKGLSLFQLTGKLDDLAASKILKRQRDQSGWPNGFRRLLVDVREASLEMTTGGVQQLAWRQNELFKFEPGSQMALVVGTSLASYGMALLYQAHREHTRLAVGVFRSLREAHVWLGIQEGSLE